MTTHRFVTALARALGALHAGVGVFQLLSPEWAPLFLAAVVAAGVFVAGRSLANRPLLQDVVVFGYLAPFAAVAALMLIARAPATWPLAAGLLRWFFAAVVTGTPASAYLVCLAYACFVAGRKPPVTIYR